LKRKTTICIALATVLLLAACNGANTEAPTQTPAMTVESQTPSPSPTLSPEVTPEVATEAPVATPLPEPLPDIAQEDVVNGLKYMLLDGKLYSLRSTYKEGDYGWTTELLVSDGVHAEPVQLALLQSYANELYLLDDNTLLMGTDWDSLSYQYDLSTNEAAECFTGAVQCVDYVRRVVYYSIYNDMSARGLYEIGFDNLSGTGLFISEGSFEAYDEAAGVLYLSRPTSMEEFAELALYSLNLQTREEKLLTVLARTDEDFGYSNDSIPMMHIGTERVMFTLGAYQGTGNYFYGVLCAMDKDGGNLTRIAIGDIGDIQPEFEMINDIAYVSGAFVKASGEGYGVFQVSADLEEFNMLLPNAHTIGTFGDILVYEESVETGTGFSDMKFYDTATGEQKLFMSYGAFPVFENFNYIQYYDVYRMGAYILYSVDINAYDPEEDNWRGHYAYSVTNLAEIDGTTVRTLFEEFTDEPISIGG